MIWFFRIHCPSILIDRKIEPKAVGWRKRGIRLALVWLKNSLQLIAARCKNDGDEAFDLIEELCFISTKV
ncbi:unnamed protein product [Citrullus colocynthis]|uniref:Uncharacterized protein n=1 Tax=Citrullus colocynthis TaxID=252529 RepID=A0ABP0YAK8_9ROSI